MNSDFILKFIIPFEISFGLAIAFEFRVRCREAAATPSRFSLVPYI
ncbi:hypothetical protein [Planktothrix tepida]|nr:hypothetical protein [Planktothrix tepida]